MPCHPFPKGGTEQRAAGYERAHMGSPGCEGGAPLDLDRAAQFGRGGADEVGCERGTWIFVWGGVSQTDTLVTLKP